MPQRCVAKRWCCRCRRLLSRRCRSLSRDAVVLSFAGRQRAYAPVHAAIAALQTGDVLTLRRDGERWHLVDANGIVVGRLAQAYAGKAGCVCVLATVAALVRRFRSDGQPEYGAPLCCDTRKVVVPDLVFEPAR